MDNPLPWTPALQCLFGLLILILGRRLFWLFVGVIGFFFGVQFGAVFFAGLADWQLLLLSLCVGLVCAGLTVLLQYLAVMIAGGFAGAMLAYQIAPALGLHTSAGQWAAFLAGGVLAAVILYVLFEPALIVLSAVIGALMIGAALPLDNVLEPLVVGILFVIGVVVQLRLGLPASRRNSA